MQGKPRVVHYMANMVVEFGVLLFGNFFFGPTPNSGCFIGGGFFAIVDLQYNRLGNVVRVFLYHSLEVMFLEP